MHVAAAIRARMRLFVVAVLAVVLSTLLVQSAGAVSADLVISQVYGGGGNTGAQYNADFIEIFNRGSAPVSLGDKSLQYASATGTGNFGATTTQLTELPDVTLDPGRYFLVQEASGANGVALPAPDFVDDLSPIAMAAGAGKVALVTGDDSLGCNGGSAVCDAAALARIVDLVGYGSANFSETLPAPTLSNTTAAHRAGGGCVDTDSNFADFTAAAPTPRTFATSVNDCSADTAPSVSARTPAPGAADVPLGSDITIIFSEPVDVTGAWFMISCATSGIHAATASGGPTTFTLNPDVDFANGEGCAVTVFGGLVTDQDPNDPPNTMAGNDIWSFRTVAAESVRIREIQGAGHVSPRVGTAVSGVPGIVTAKRTNGYYMQDPSPDADDATSEGIFVFTSSAPSVVSVGDSVLVSGTVVEFRPGGASSTNLSLTEISGPTTTVVSSGNPLPATTVIGAAGRIPPTEVIEDDAAGSVETSGVFDPAQDGIDFYESLEAMRAQVNNPVVVGPRNSFGETFVLADDGAGAAARTGRGGIVIRPTDFNPERIQLDDAVLPGSTPFGHVGDHLSGPAVGVVDYDFGNFEIELTSALTTVTSGLARETTEAPAAKDLSVATYNVENLDALEPQSKFDAIAAQIVGNLRSPDVISLEEIQDNNGATNDDVVDASQTLTKLVNAISAAGGPSYDFRQIDPLDDQDGGEPGGNIRVGFLFRTDRGLAFVDRPGGGSTTPTTVVSGPAGPELSASPGRVDPTNTAWASSRKPLAGEFTYRGERFFLITNHFNSKGGDQPLYGRFQPPNRSSETQRHQQAQIVNGFVDSILALDADANVIVLGDINDFEFSQTMTLLEGGALHALMSTLPQAERYSYVFEGNSQSLDHILASGSLFGGSPAYDAVHINAEFHDQLSDHDPQVARFFVNSAPTGDAGGPYTVPEGGSVALSGSGTDPNGDALTYAWDLDNNGSFETGGQTPTFSAVTLDGPSAHTVAVRVSDGTVSVTDQATVNVINIAPTASLSAPTTVFAGFSFTVALVGASDPSGADMAAGFQYAFDCGTGYGAIGTSAAAQCLTTSVGAQEIGAMIRDKDLGVTEYPATVNVVVTFDSLCDLARTYATDPTVADQLCHKLEQAEASPTGGAREGLLDAFRNYVDAKIGNGLTAAQANVLRELSTEL